MHADAEAARRALGRVLRRRHQPNCQRRFPVWPHASAGRN